MRKTVSHSEVDSFLACQRKHFYQYGMEITRKYQSDALNTGIIGHKSLETFFLARMNGKDFETAKQECIDNIAEAMGNDPSNSLVIGKAMQAILYFFENGGMAEYDILAVEKEFVLPITEDLELPFVVDLIVREKSTGRIGVVDSKFTSRFYTDRATSIMGQLPKYLGGLRALGYPVNFAAYSILRTEGAVKDTYKERYQFIEVPLSDARIQRTFTEQVYASLAIQEVKKQDLATWSDRAVRIANGFECPKCSMYNLCVAELDQNRPDMVLDGEYKKKERREFKDSTNTTKDDE